MAKHFFYFISLILLSCSSYKASLPDLSKTDKVQISYYGYDSIKGKDFCIDISKNPGFLKLIKANYISHDSCKADGKIMFLDSNNVKILEGTFSVECQSLFLNGSNNTYIFSSNAAEELLNHFPYKRRPPKGVMGIISNGMTLSKKDLSYDLIGQCKMKLYDQNHDLFQYDKIDAIDISIVDEVQKDIIFKGIDSISHVNRWDIIKDTSRLRLKLVFQKYYEPYKIRKITETSDGYLPVSILQILFLNSNCNIGVCGHNLIYFDSTSCKLIKTLIAKKLKSKM